MYAERRQQLLQKMEPQSIAILLGASLVTRSNDTDYPFRQHSDFLYLTGFTHPNAVGILRETDGQPEFILFVEPRSREREIWSGPRPGIEGARQDFGAQDAYSIEALSSELPKLLTPAKQIYHSLGVHPEVDQILIQLNQEARRNSRKGAEPPRAIFDLQAVVHEMRLFKTWEEIEILRKAASITLEAHRETAKLAQPGRHEYELQAMLEYQFRKLGASGPAYESIVGSGKNATILHYITNQDLLRENELVLIDAGCELKGYASDVTRTYPVGGKFTAPHRELYEVVLAAQEAAIAEIRPGNTLKEIHNQTLENLTGGLVKLGILQGDVKDLVKAEAYRPYYMHGTSHWLGLDVHDVGSYTTQGDPRPLEAGMVFTVEPGLYFPADDSSIDPSLRGTGIRIEDNVLVTDSGHEVLTSAIPKKVEEIEAWVQGKSTLPEGESG